jgi:hypothetical protein
MAYAEASDVAVRWGKAIESLEEPTVALIETRLGDAERMIKRRIPDLDAKIDADTLDVEDVKQVEADMVLRLVRNPDGYLSETDGNYTYMLQQNLSAGRLTVEPEEWETLGLIRSRMSIIVPNLPTIT